MNNIYNRYIWLLHTVYQERKVTFERLCDIWKHHFLYNGKPLSLRTFHHHRKMIEENFDIVIACNRKDYTYYIQNLDEILGDSCRNWLFNSRIIDVALKAVRVCSIVLYCLTCQMVLNTCRIYRNVSAMGMNCTYSTRMTRVMKWKAVSDRKV